MVRLPQFLVVEGVVVVRERLNRLDSCDLISSHLISFAYHAPDQGGRHRITELVLQSWCIGVKCRNCE